MKTYLNVSYEEKDEAKILGAKWDNIEKNGMLRIQKVY